MNKNDSIYQTIAEASNSLKIKLIKQLGDDDKNQIIELSKELGPIFGNDAILTISNIDKYFNKNTYPFIAEFNNHIIGFIIGVPLEVFSEESWSHYDINLGKNNTIYTYIYLMKKNYRKQGGYSKTLKMIYLNWCKKNNYNYVTGHVKSGISKKFSNSTKVVKIFPKWYNSKYPFEYYRRPL
ncbi:MAG: hypothetical protein CMG25_04655 [Candidatus Marinimicrobia bacterium]|nr:hypothetical protein [Candidatus Neomarinimicrobiota bacterium]|tara:strand:- start:5780 stop:6325 length:546 start_codon:yes stop_codon:yes gene_type:complete